MKAYEWTFVILWFATVVYQVSGDTEILLQEPNKGLWAWHTKKRLAEGVGWNAISTAKPVYGVCDISTTKEPTNWLRTDFINVKDAKLLNINLDYSLLNCPGQPDSGIHCKTSFSLFVFHIDKKTTPAPEPFGNVVKYEEVKTFTHTNLPDPGKLRVYNRHAQVLTKDRGVYLAFKDQGSCVSIRKVIVSYNYCSEMGSVLVRFKRTAAPVNDSHLVEQEGECSDPNSVNKVKLSGVCLSIGEWNVTDGIKCFCKAGYELVHGSNSLECSAVPLVLPSHPRSVYVTFVNKTSAMITWLPPAISGGQVFYEVDCEKTCKECDEKTCDDEAGLVSHKKILNTTHVTITTLSPFVNYTCKIMAKNRVSEVVGKKHRVFANVTLKTQGSVPGKPDVSVTQAEDASTELSWELNCENGNMKRYHVTYFRKDDSSDKETLTTNPKETNVRIKKLAPGKTFLFKVVAENNYGRGPAGETTFKIPSASDDSNNRNTMIIYIVAVSTVLGVVLFIVSALFGLYVYRQRKSQNMLPQSVDISQAFEGHIDGSEMVELNMDVIEERNIDDVINHAQYMEITDIPSFEMERGNIEFLRLLGSGNFGEVYKATMGHVAVAVKSLKETATAKDKMDMVTELNVMKRLKPHPHVLKLIGCCSHSDPLLIVLEYLPYGDLLGYLRKSRGHSDSYHSGEKKPTSKLTANDLLSFAWMIADGMNYLAKMKIVHRDLAARNILVGEDKVCKISDFGLARDINADIYVRASKARLPVKWMPPESLFRGESSTMSDVWSYGIVLWEVFTIGDSPYPGVKAREVSSLLERGYRMSRPVHISEELFSIFSECWSEKPQDRPTFQWICTAVKRLIEDQKTYINLDVYNDKDYVNFDMVDEQQ